MREADPVQVSFPARIETTPARRFSILASFASLFVVAVSLLVLTGWQFDIQILRRVLPGLTAMNPGTATWFILAGAALWRCVNNSAAPAISRACAVIVILLSAVQAICLVFRIDVGPDQLLFHDKMDLEILTTGRANRMAPNTAFAFFLTGFALLMLDVKLRRLWVAQGLALAVGLLALLTIIGYAYGMLALTGVKSFIPMALNTAICFAALSFGILCARPERGLMEVFAGSGASNKYARKTLPAVMLVPAVIGGCIAFAQRNGLLDEGAALSFFALSNIIFLTAIIWWNADILHTAEQQLLDSDRALKHAKEEADRANMAKSDFLSHMSHELRTPLNSIIGLTRLLQDDKALGREQRDMARVAYKSGESLLVIVNDILDLAKVEAGRLQLENIVFSIHEVMQGVTETMMPLCSEKGLQFISHIEGEDVVYFMGDPTRLTRVMINLVGNSIKYTETGSVTVNLRVERSGETELRLSCEVIDTGIGIAKDKQQQIFGKFTQADSSITRRFGGTGLGLSITKQFIEKMGGSIGVESTEGKGSRFWFTLPFAAADTAPVAERRVVRETRKRAITNSQRVPAAAARVLVAEDYYLNQSFMKSLLSRLGVANAEIVGTGDAAVEASGRGGFDVVLMDCHMPVMSGLDATKLIRQREVGGAAHLPIIAMTADAMMGTRDRCLKAGMDDYISKPIDMDELRDIMSQWIAFPEEEKEGDRPAQNTSAPVVDLADLLDLMGNDADVNNLVELFFSQSEEMLLALGNSCLDGPCVAWSETAHKLKGGAAMLKAKDLAALCDEAQKFQNVTSAERKLMLEKIRRAYDEVKRAVNNPLGSAGKSSG